MRRRRRIRWHKKTRKKPEPSEGKLTPTGQANIDIEIHLRERHFLDIVVSEAMSAKPKRFEAGVTRRRLDFWVIAMSWTRPEYIGYEIKCTRADFLGDEKTHHYEGQCTKFVWVTAPGVVKEIDEIPAGHGWQELSKTGKSLITRKAAPELQPDQAQLFNALKSAFMRHLNPWGQQ